MRIIDRSVIFVEPVKIGERIRDLVQMNDGTILLWTDSAHFIELTVRQEPIAAALPLTKAETDIGLEEVIRGCIECHSFRPGKSNAESLSMWGVYNRRIADTDFTEYSDSLMMISGAWNEESLKAYLTDPQQFAPGTMMPDPAINNTEQLDALIQYLKKLK
jgi:cytochrome c